jgi:predicted nuclease of predicted toxin-antitoxin system
MRLLIDVCLPVLWAEVLRAAGHDVQHWLHVGPATATDYEIMAHAVAEDRIVFTHDLDFSAILSSTEASGPSIVQLREQDVDPARIGSAVLAALGQCGELLESGAIVTIDLRRTRARALPLRRTR